MQYFSAVARNVFAIERWRLRSWSAARRALIVMGALLLGWSWLGPETGALAASTALFVGLQDRATALPAVTVRLMTMESFALAIFAAIAWPSLHTPIPGVLLVLLAFLAGSLAGRKSGLSRMAADVVTVEAFLGVSDAAASFGPMTIAFMLAAGLTQTLFTWLASNLQTDLPERRPLAEAMRLVATHLSDAQPRALSGTGESAQAALLVADETIRRTDLSRDRRFELEQLILHTEGIRQEASAIRAHRALGTAALSGHRLNDSISLAVDSLNCVASMIGSEIAWSPIGKQAGRFMDDFSWLVGRANSIAEDPTASTAARGLAQESRQLIRHASRLLEARLARERRKHNLIKDGFDALIHPTATDMRSGFRLATAAALGLLLALALPLEHGYWIAATAVVLLRPDGSAIVTQTAARALGTAGAVALVIPGVILIQGLDDRTATQVAAFLIVALAAIAALVLVEVNQGLYVLAVAFWVILTLSLLGESPTEVALERFGDTLLGCSLAILLVMLLPMRSVYTLRDELQSYAQACASWLHALADLVAGEPSANSLALHRRMLRMRVPVQHQLEIREVEPVGPGISRTDGKLMFDRIHRVERAAGAVEALVRHGRRPSDAGKLLAQYAASEMELAAALLEHDPDPELAVEPLHSLSDRPDGQLGDLLVITAQESHESAVTAARISLQDSARTDAH